MTNADDEARLIPDWAALVTVFGVVITAASFVAAWITDSGLATATLTVGLALVAYGMSAAEKAISHRN